MWFSCVSSTSRKRLQIIQNKLIRFILGISTRSHIGYREFSSSNMLPVEYRVTQLKLNHMFNIVHGSAPEYLKNNINITREPAHNTRSGSFACYIPNVKSRDGTKPIPSTRSIGSFLKYRYRRKIRYGYRVLFDTLHARVL